LMSMIPGPLHYWMAMMLSTRSILYEGLHSTRIPPSWIRTLDPTFFKFSGSIQSALYLPAGKSIEVSVVKSPSFTIRTYAVAG
jgi:hypothetical protein